MIIHCLYCGHTIELGDAYDEYQGPVRCAVCKGLMTVRMDEGLLRSMEAATKTAAVPGALKARLSHPS